MTIKIKTSEMKENTRVGALDVLNIKLMDRIRFQQQEMEITKKVEIYSK